MKVVRTSSGMDKTFQRGDLGKYGVLVKVVPVHWKKGKDLDTNTISCWYRPGYRWSKQRGQHVVPPSLKHFKVKTSPAQLWASGGGDSKAEEESC